MVAKQILKEAGAYKKGTHGQGGLGGVGVENWILQNNGSLEAAAREFLESAKGRNFDEFKDVYRIYDFGQNHVAIERGQGIAYNEFVYDNMTPEGYEAMRSKLIEEFPEVWEEIRSKK